MNEEKSLPDLVVIDGGKGQLNAAHAALDALGLGAMPIISLAKREEEIFVLGRSESLRLPRRSPALRMLQQARDEAHRFAITFQRKRRSMRTITSELLRIPGVGESKRRQLLAAFGSLQGVREATPEAIAALAGLWTEDRGAHSRGAAQHRARRAAGTSRRRRGRGRGQPLQPISREHLAPRMFRVRRPRIGRRARDRLSRLRAAVSRSL